MPARITEAAAIKPFVVYLKFKDGAEGAADLSDIVGSGGVFNQLSDIKYFASMVFDEKLGTICWPNGADICPDSLYKRISKS